MQQVIVGEEKNIKVYLLLLLNPSSKTRRTLDELL